MPTTPARYRDDTDDYLAKMGVTRPINTVPEATTPLVATNDRPRRKKETRRTVVARVVLAVLGLLVAGASIIGLVTLVGTFGFFQYLLPIAFWPCAIACAFGLLIAIFAFIAACTKLTCASVGTVILAGFIAGFGIGGVAVAVGISNGNTLDTVSKRWNSTVQSQPHEVCLFESFFDCTGWLTQCNGTSATNSSSQPAPTWTPDTPTPSSNDTATPETTGWTWPSPDTTHPHSDTPRPSPDSQSGSNFDADADRFESSSSGGFNPSTHAPDHSTTPSPWNPYTTPAPGQTSTAMTTTSAAGTSTTPATTHSNSPAPTHAPTPPPPPTPPPVYACLTCPGQTTNLRECRGAVMAELQHQRAPVIAGLLGIALIGIIMIVCLAIAHLAVKTVAV